VNTSNDRVMRALGRILRTWSLIQMMPTERVMLLQSPLLELLSSRPDLNENELVVLGIKHLYATRRGGDVESGTLSTSGMSALMRQLAPHRTHLDEPEGRQKRRAPYIVTVIRERSRVSTSRRSIDEAIEAAERYRSIGAADVSIEAPDGQMYGSDQFDILRRSCQT
jgi:hypothetical protein